MRSYIDNHSFKEAALDERIMAMDVASRTEFTSAIHGGLNALARLQNASNSARGWDTAEFVDQFENACAYHGIAPYV